ncbi:glycosyltransferase family 2 protein [Kistimonas asteriae]|uniref:glycosyltransferase family 2 protein n=1 Tax=Kistimonas asteriae TaxID=517724 RepID=UPI001BA882A9|nr:glycosyltransferase family A protein [Kistimonas asteriae]
MNMKALPLVSVLVPCYNHQNYVKDAINSILNQTYSNIELIVLDDGSTDNSPAILAELSEKHGFYYEHQQNMGLNGTLNKGLSLAKGQYICPFASDDVMFLDRIEKQVALLESRPDVAVCAGNMIAISETGEIASSLKIRPAREVDFDDLFWRKIPGPAAPTAMIRSSVIDEVGHYDPDIRIEDLYMWLKITHAGHKIYILNDVLAYYRKHTGNFHSNYKSMLENELRIIGSYASHPKYNEVKKRLLISTFVKTANRDKLFAKELLGQISFFDAPLKISKGVVRLIAG